MLITSEEATKSPFYHLIIQIIVLQSLTDQVTDEICLHGKSDNWVYQDEFEWRKATEEMAREVQLNPLRKEWNGTQRRDSSRLRWVAEHKKILE